MQESVFGWSDGENGLYLAVMGFSTIPVTGVMGILSAHVNDRVLTVCSLTLTLAGCAKICVAQIADATYLR